MTDGPPPARGSALAGPALDCRNGLDDGESESDVVLRTTFFEPVERLDDAFDIGRIIRVAVFARVADCCPQQRACRSAADVPSRNPEVQYRSFSCDDGRTYDAGYVGGSSGDFFLVTSTGTFAIKVFSEIFPSGEVKTFNYGVAGFRDKELLTCSYTDPAGVFNAFQGFPTPRS